MAAPCGIVGTALMTRKAHTEPTYRKALIAAVNVLKDGPSKNMPLWPWRHQLTGDSANDTESARLSLIRPQFWKSTFTHLTIRASSLLARKS